jgi:thiol-disulfide isomerase/thioredoxin
MPTRYRKNRHRHRKKKTIRRRRPSSNLIAYGKIYATWCGHCQAMDSYWSILESKMLPLKSHNIESEQKDTMIADFNQKYNTNLQLKGGFPTIFKLTKTGGIEYYEQDRNLDGILNWLRTNPNSSSHKPKGILNQWF